MMKLLLLVKSVQAMESIVHPNAIYSPIEEAQNPKVVAFGSSGQDQDPTTILNPAAGTMAEYWQTSLTTAAERCSWMLAVALVADGTHTTREAFKTNLNVEHAVKFEFSHEDGNAHGLIDISLKEPRKWSFGSIISNVKTGFGIVEHILETGKHAWDTVKSIFGWDKKKDTAAAATQVTAAAQVTTEQSAAQQPLDQAFNIDSGEIDIGGMINLITNPRDTLMDSNAKIARIEDMTKVPLFWSRKALREFHRFQMQTAVKGREHPYGKLMSFPWMASIATIGDPANSTMLGVGYRGRFAPKYLQDVLAYSRGAISENTRAERAKAADTMSFREILEWEVVKKVLSEVLAVVRTNANDGATRLREGTMHGTDEAADEWLGNYLTDLKGQEIV